METGKAMGFSVSEMKARLEETGNWDGDGAIKTDSGLFVSVEEAMRLFDVSPMLRRFGTWAVTEYGVECLAAHYAIEKARLNEPDWLSHVGGKTWVVYEDIRDALIYAQAYFKVQRSSRPVRREPPTIPGSERRSRTPGMSNRLRFLVLKRDRYACQLCGRTAQQGYQIQVDHKVARKNGGTNEMDNLWALCALCNNGKGVDDL